MGKMTRNAYCVRREQGAGAGSEWVKCRLRLLLSWLEARGSAEGRVSRVEGRVKRGARGCMEDWMMISKVAWVVAGLMGLLWVEGVAEGWFPGTPKLRLSVSPGVQGVAHGHVTNGTHGTNGAAVDPITRDASLGNFEPRASSQERGSSRLQAPSFKPEAQPLGLAFGRFVLPSTPLLSRVIRRTADVTTHASRVRKKGKARGAAEARRVPVHPSDGMPIDVSGGSAPGSPLFSLKRGELGVREGLMARGEKGAVDFRLGTCDWRLRRGHAWVVTRDGRGVGGGLVRAGRGW